MAVGEFFFTPLVLYIVPKYCHDEFFVNLNFFHGMLESLRSNRPCFMLFIFPTGRRECQKDCIHFQCERSVILWLPRMKSRVEHKAIHDLWTISEFMALDRVLMFRVAQLTYWKFIIFCPIFAFDPKLAMLLERHGLHYICLWFFCSCLSEDCTE